MELILKKKFKDIFVNEGEMHGGSQRDAGNIWNMCLTGEVHICPSKDVSHSSPCLGTDLEALYSGELA